jgi:flagellar hook-associated protein 3 FlgL
MSITGPGSITAANLTAQTNMFKQLNTLSQELGTGDASQTYSGLGSQAGVALSLESQIAAFNAYSTTASTVGTTLTLAQSVLTQLDSARTSVKQALNQQNAFSLNGNGQTATQQQAAGYLDQILSLLNTQAGDNYMFSGSAVNQPSVASASTILNGNGAQAGLTQVISERLQADEGVGNQGRLTIGGTAPAVTLTADTSPFGFKLASVSSSLTGATATGPSGSPPQISVNLGSNPNAGDSISFGLTLPDGSSQTITLQATTASPPGANQFTIGATATATATNLQSALSTAVSNLAQDRAARGVGARRQQQLLQFRSAAAGRSRLAPGLCHGDVVAERHHRGHGVLVHRRKRRDTCPADCDRPGLADYEHRLRHARQ